MPRIISYRLRQWEGAMSDLMPIRTITGVREMVDVLREPTAPGAPIKSTRYRVRITQVMTGVHRIVEWLPEELQRFKNDVQAGLR